MNYPLRLLNHLLGKPHTEAEIQEAERNIQIVIDNQKYNGLSDYPDIQEALKYCGEKLIETSKNETSTIPNLLAGIGCLKSIIDIQVEKLKKEYDREGKKIESLIKSENQNG
jgi:hypothetical protein